MSRFVLPYSKECAYPDRHSQGTCNIAHERMALEVKCIRYTLRELKKDGWLPVQTYDGQDVIATTTESAVLDTVYSVDMSVVYVRHTDGRKSSFDVILGNGIDVVGGDYGHWIANIMHRVYDRISWWE
jgi:hypothetical protein